MAQDEQATELPVEQEYPGRIPVIFPAGDLDEMIFYEEYVVLHSGR